MIKSMIEQKQEIIEFFKNAFCVDGEVKMILDKSEMKSFKTMGVMKLTDSRRKTFYFGLLERK